MALATASRFAVLSIEDDEDDEKTNKTGKTNSNKKVSKAQKPDDKKKKQQQQSKKKSDKKNQGIDQELKNLAFGVNKPKKLSSISRSNSDTNKKAVSVLQQPEVEDPEWKKKNEEAESRMFEEDIQQAIFLSKIDFEEKREFYEAMRQETEEAKLAAKKKKKLAKKEKASTMTLEEFNSLSPAGISNMTTDGDEGRLRLSQMTEDNFFRDVEQDVKKMLNKEQEKDTFKKREPHVSVDVRLLQLQNQLENKDLELEGKELEIEQLTLERDKFKEEHAILKKMNAKLLSLLAEGKTKDKYDALMQVEDLNKEKDELTHEITLLHAALEQERSKVHNLQQLLRSLGNRKDLK